MTHKAGEEFFDQKREWSARKDRILGSYLAPYLAKISRLKRPVLIVDGFSGPGKFGDNEPGSPLIIAQTIRKHFAKTLAHRVDVSLLCIEQDRELYQSLDRLMTTFDFAIAREGSFSEHVDRISAHAPTHSLFIYVDPFTVEGLKWVELAKLFDSVRSGNSVEVLINFNGRSFVRRGLAAMQVHLQGSDDDSASQEDDVDAAFDTPASVEKLNEVVGGDWWQEELGKYPHASSFADCVLSISERFTKNLAQYFDEACFHHMLAEPRHTVPKYTLVFGSRSPEALILMNDEMAKSLQTLAKKAEPIESTLFETRPKTLVPDFAPVIDSIITKGAVPIRRRDLITYVIRQHFGKFRYAQIRGQVESLLKNGVLTSETGRSKINDEIKVWTSLQDST